jgi:hypothetical protein
MAVNSSTLLKRLERLKTNYDGGAAPRKIDLLERLERRRLSTADQLLRFHELLCFQRAYPDNTALLEVVERLLEGFEERSDLRRHRAALIDSTIAGTTTYYAFFYFTAIWLANHWPDRLSIDWDEFSKQDELLEMLHLLMPFSESPGLDMLDYSPRQWLDAMRGPNETDATFLIKRFEALPVDEWTREMLYESLDVPIKISPGPDTPSRTCAKYVASPVVCQSTPLSRLRPSMREELRQPPQAVRMLSAREGERVIDLVREAMVSRHRDLYTFSHADPHDVRMVECGDGLQFACIGANPRRRLMFETSYGFLTLKNGVPVGYVLASSLFNSTELAYNIFDTFRGGEAAAVFGRVVAMTGHLFGSNTFSIDPYQLGHGNDEGLQSGAWWFYYKLGFRPVDPDVQRILRGELKKMKADPTHRSDLETLNELSSESMFLQLGRERSDVLGQVDLGQAGLATSQYLSRRFGADREQGLDTCSREAAQLVGLRSRRGWSPGEQLAWQRWSPLILLMPGVGTWTAAEKRALVKVVRAKGGRSESDFVLLFDAHRRLRRAVLKLMR